MTTYHPDMPLRQFIREIYAPARNLGSDTLNSYLAAVATLRQHHGREFTIGELTADVQAVHLEWLETTYAIATMSRLASQLATLARFYEGQMLSDERALRREARRQASLNRASVTLFDYFVKVYCPQKLRGRSNETKQQYFYMLDKFEAFLGYEPTPADLTDDNANGLLAWLSDKNMAARSINNCRSYLLALWRFLARKRIVDLWPDVEMEIQPDKIPCAWSMEQLGRLLESCRQEPGEIGGVTAGDWWFAIHVIMYYSGERPGAMLQLAWQHYDASTGDLIVPAEVRKGKRKPMLYTLNSQSVLLLAKIREPKRDLIFPWDRCITTFYNRYTRILKRADLPYGRDSKPHRMRRTFASHLEAAGGNATAALSHASRSITEKSYIDPRICRARNPSDLLPQLILEGGAL